MTAKCRSCEKVQPRNDLALVERKVGGSYNRASRWQPCLICRECTVDLLDNHQTPGHRVVNRWSLSGLRCARARWEATE